MAGLVKRLSGIAKKYAAVGALPVARYGVWGKFYNSHHRCQKYLHILESPIETWYMFSSQRKLSSHIMPFKLSDIGEGITDVTIKEWYVKVGDKVSQFDNICEVQSDKASVTITSRYDGTIKKLHYNVDDMALVGKPLVDIEVPEGTEVPITLGATKDVPGIRAQIVSTRAKALATPAVRRMASEEKIALHDVKGSGKHGRVLKEDLITFLERKKSVKPIAAVTPLKEISATLHPKVTDAQWTEPIRGFAKAMVKTMTIANNIPHFVYSDDIDMRQLVDVIQQLKKNQTTPRFTYMPFFIKAASKSLLKFPLLNSSLDEKCENVTYKAYHNIGVAMDTPSGLIVPNVKGVERLSVRQIAEEVARLHAQGLAGALQPADLSGGTFTLSNIGTIGGTSAKPVILPPEVAIGVLGSIQVLPRFDENDNVVKTRSLCVSWAADHRIIDGATMARFSNVWKHYVQNPLLVLLDL